MAVIAPPRRNLVVPTRSVAAFVGITFLITWGTAGVYILFPDRAVAWFGEISGTHPFFFLATWAPAIAALIVVFAYGGAAGLKHFLSRLLLWRCSWWWAAFMLIGPPLVFMAGSLIQGGPLLAPLPPEGIAPVIAVMLLMLFLGPVEELGWRGVAQPLLQRHMAPIWAGLIIGVIWGIWHLPAFFLAGAVHSGWSFAPFFIGTIVLSVLFTPLFNQTRGSLLLPMLFHWQWINPFWPDAHATDTWILVGVAVVVVWLNRASLFTRANAITEVVPGEQAREAASRSA